MTSGQAKEFIKMVSELIEGRISLKDHPDAFLIVAEIEDELVKLLTTGLIAKSEPEDPHKQKPQNLECPECGGVMVSRKNKTEGTFFWGCKSYPDCHGTRDSEGNAKGERARDRAPEPKRWNVR